MVELTGLLQTLNASSILLAFLVFVVAVLYSSVGHGGASGYLAILTLFSLPTVVLSGTGLVLNVAVSTIALITFRRAGHKLPRFTVWLVVCSIPFSFLGGMWKVADNIYHGLLAFALLFAAVRLSLGANSRDQEVNSPNRWVLGSTGAAIAFLSGVVGIGGGVFLSPLTVLMRWTAVKSAATLSALFILVNSLSGIAGRAFTGRLVVEPAISLLIAAIAGGIVGSQLGANRLGTTALRRVLAFVLVIAAAKAIFSS